MQIQWSVLEAPRLRYFAVDRSRTPGNISRCHQKNDETCSGTSLLVRDAKSVGQKVFEKVFLAVIVLKYLPSLGDEPLPLFLTVGMTATRSCEAALHIQRL